jgi:hypothetical protein
MQAISYDPTYKGLISVTEEIQLATSVDDEAVMFHFGTVLQLEDGACWPPINVAVMFLLCREIGCQSLPMVALWDPNSSGISCSFRSFSFFLFQGAVAR